MIDRQDAVKAEAKNNADTVTSESCVYITQGFLFYIYYILIEIMHTPWGYATQNLGYATRSLIIRKFLASVLIFSILYFQLFTGYFLQLRFLCGTKMYCYFNLAFTRNINKLSIIIIFSYSFIFTIIRAIFICPKSQLKVRKKIASQKIRTTDIQRSYQLPHSRYLAA